MTASASPLSSLTSNGSGLLNLFINYLCSSEFRIALANNLGGHLKLKLETANVIRSIVIRSTVQSINVLGLFWSPNFLLVYHSHYLRYLSLVYRLYLVYNSAYFQCTDVKLWVSRNMIYKAVQTDLSDDKWNVYVFYELIFNSLPFPL